MKTDQSSLVKKYTKKPITIEAVRLTFDNLSTVKEWCGGQTWSRPPMRAITGISITTLAGKMDVEFGDWVIKGVEGEFYPCTPDIFEATYGPEGESQITTEQAVSHLMKQLRKDEGYYQSWKDNIAIAIKDEFEKMFPAQPMIGKGDIHVLANAGADRFLKMLLFTPKKEEDDESLHSKR